VRVVTLHRWLNLLRNRWLEAKSGSRSRTKARCKDATRIRQTRAEDNQTRPSMRFCMLTAWRLDVRSDCQTASVFRGRPSHAPIHLRRRRRTIPDKKADRHGRRTSTCSPDVLEAGMRGTLLVLDWIERLRANQARKSNYGESHCDRLNRWQRLRPATDSARSIVPIDADSSALSLSVAAAA